MALLEEQFTETLDAGAPDITYQGNEGKEQKIARQLWDQLPNEVRMQFGSFQQFFSSGAWKEVLARLQQAQEQTPERIQETETIEEQPQQGLASMMPAQMAGGGDVQLASHESNDAFLEQQMEYYLEQGFSPRKAAEQAQKDLMEGNYQDMADGGRPGYFLGKIVKKITKPIKKLAKSPIGKAALLGAGIYGLGGGLGGPGNWGIGKAFKFGNIGKTLFGAKPFKYGVPFTDAMQTSAGTQGIFGKLGLTKGLGSKMPTALGWGAAASLAPFAMAATGNWDTGAEEIDDLKLKAAEFGFDYSQMIQDLQTAVATGSEAELAKVLSQYNLSRGDMPGSKYIGTTAAEGGRIGYKDGGIYETALMDAWRTYQAQGGTLSLEEFADGWMKAMMEGKAQGGRIGYAEGGLGAGDKQVLISKLVEMGLPLPQAMKMAEMIIANATPEELQRTLAGTRRQGLTPKESIKFQENIETPTEDIDLTGQVSKLFPLDPRVQVPEEYVSLSGAMPDARAAMLGRMQQPKISEMMMEKFRTPRGMEESVEEIRESLPEGMNEGGLMSLGGMEMDLRGGGFVPIGKVEKADDVPARLSKNEFVFTADAVRAAGDGNVDKGADKMYKTMKQLESRVG